MAIQKTIARIAGILSIMMLALALLLERLGITFWENCCISLFASGVLVFVSALVTFFIERQNNLYKLYCSCIDFTQVAPFNRVLTGKEDFLKTFEDIQKATSIYNREISILVDEMVTVYQKKSIKNVLKQISKTSKTLNNSLLDLNEKMADCCFQNREFDEFIKNDFAINRVETVNAAKSFTEAINSLVEYIKTKKIHDWEDTNNAD